VSSLAYTTCATHFSKLTHALGWRRRKSDHLQTNRELFPADRVLDFPFMEQYGVRLVPLNVSLSRFAVRFAKRYGEEKILTIFHPERENWHKEHVLKFAQDRHALLFFKGASMFHHWFATDTMVKLRKFVRYAPYLRQLAVRIANTAFGPTFYAMHIRMGDYSDRMGDSSVGFLRSARAKKWRARKYITYVATEPARDKDYFAPLEQGMNVTFSTDLPPSVLDEFKKLFPPGQLRNDMLGLLEQLICVQAVDFLGTSFSTFSAWIVFARKFRGLLYPEMGAVVNLGSTASTSGAFVTATGTTAQAGQAKATAPKEAEEEEEGQ